MKTISPFKVDNELAAQISRTVKTVKLGEADTLRHALRLGLPILARRLNPDAGDDYFEREYGLAKEEADRIARNLLAEGDTLAADGRLRPWKPGKP